MAKNDDKTPEADKAATEAAKVKTAAEEQARKDAEAESTEGLVKMHKDGTHFHVHPTTVDAHKAAGWKHA